VSAHAVALAITLSQGVTLRRATIITPTLTPLEPVSTSPSDLTFRLGDLEQTRPVRVLLELLAPPAPPLGDMHTRRVRLAQTRAVSATQHAPVSLDLVARYTSTPQPIPAAVRDAAARANTVRIQRRALDAAASGDRDTALSLLRSLAARLHELGETGLAGIALQEAAELERTGKTTRLGAKELTYATRRLGSQ
jgi:hypothetical protein